MGRGTGHSTAAGADPRGVLAARRGAGSARADRRLVELQALTDACEAGDVDARRPARRFADPREALEVQQAERELFERGQMRACALLWAYRMAKPRSLWRRESYTPGQRTRLALDRLACDAALIAELYGAPRDRLEQVDADPVCGVLALAALRERRLSLRRGETFPEPLPEPELDVVTASEAGAAWDDLTAERGDRELDWLRLRMREARPFADPSPRLTAELDAAIARADAEEPGRIARYWADGERPGADWITRRLLSDMGDPLSGPTLADKLEQVARAWAAERRY